MEVDFDKKNNDVLKLELLITCINYSYPLCVDDSSFIA